MEDALRTLMNAPLREQFVVIMGVGVALALGFGFIGATIGAYFGGRIGARRAVAAMRREPQVGASAQLDEVRNALDSIAVEIERISEGQRFTTRLVAERVGQSAMSAGHRRDGGSVTPH
jgi:hypothetical protein